LAIDRWPTSLSAVAAAAAAVVVAVRFYVFISANSGAAAIKENSYDLYTWETKISDTTLITSVVTHTV